MQNNVDKVGHHYTSNCAWTEWRSQPQQQACNTSSSDQKVVQQQPSFQSQQIERLLIKWQQLQEKNTRCLQPNQQEQQQQTSLFSDNKKDEQQYLLDDFDRIMEEDLEIQLKELEREEEKQYELLTQSLEEQLTHDDSVESIEELQRTSMKQIAYTDALKQFESNEQRKHYDVLLEALEQCERQEAQLDSHKEFEQNKQHSSNKIPWYKVNPLQSRRKYQEDQRLLLARKQKHALEMQLRWIKANQIKTKQIIDLVESHWKTKKFYDVIRKPYYHGRY